MPEGDYDQEKQTKYYELIRWTVQHLASFYLDSKYDKLNFQ
jgi:hypothetical protein